MADKMRDAWINCRRLSVYVCTYTYVRKIHSSYTDACRMLESWRRNRLRETKGAKRGKPEVNHATPVTTSVRWQTSAVDVTAQEVEATSDNDLNRIKACPSPLPPHPPSPLSYNPPPVVIASLMSWEKPPQLQINRTRDQKWSNTWKKKEQVDIDVSLLRRLLFCGKNDSFAFLVIILRLVWHQSSTNVILNVTHDVTNTYIVKYHRIESPDSISNANIRCHIPHKSIVMRRRSRGSRRFSTCFVKRALQKKKKINSISAKGLNVYKRFSQRLAHEIYIVAESRFRDSWTSLIGSVIN